MAKRGLISRILGRSEPAEVIKQSEGNPLERYVMSQIASLALYPDTDTDMYLGGYTGNGDVFTTINKITEPASNVPIYQYDKNGEINEQGRMIQLLNRPNPHMSRSELIEAELTFFLIFGDSYLAYDSIPNGLNANLPIRIDPLPPQWVEFELGTYFNPIVGYKFMMSGSQRDYEFNQVMHRKEFNPDYDRNGVGHLKGMSRLRPILKSVTGSGSAYDALVSAFQHHGAVGILTILGENSSTTGVGSSLLSKIKNQFKDEYAGASKNGSIVITNKDHKWTNLGLSIVELAILDALGAFGGRINDAYNVPSMLMSGSKDRTYMNYQEAKRALYTDAIMPNLDAMLDKYTTWMAPLFKEEGQVVKADWSQVEALQKDKAALVAWMIASKSFTKNEIRAATGAEELPDPAMDKVYESAGTVPLEELGLMPNAPLTEGVMKILSAADYRAQSK